MYEIHKESLVSSNLNSKFFWFHSDRPSVHIVFQFAGLAEPEGTPLEDQLSLSQLGGAYYAPHISTHPSRFLNLPPSLNVITIKTFTRDKIDATNKRQKVDVS